jgi:hypothetical protein
MTGVIGFYPRVMEYPGWKFSRKSMTMNKSNLLLVFTVIFSLIALQSCKDDKADEGSVILNIDYVVGPEDLVFDTEQYETPQGYAYSIVTMRHYLTRLRLRQDDGSEVILTDVLYADARESGTATIDLGKVPNGSYSTFDFIFGLDEEMNVNGGLENTLENINMEWPIPGDQGYHYMKYEGKYSIEPSGEIKSFNLHTGATGGNQNYIPVSLPVGPMLVDGNTWTIDLTIDLAEWLQNPQTYDFEEFGSAIMMNQAAQEVLKANGATVFSTTAVKE